MPRWQPDARVRLVESALELFEAQGYDGTSVIEIAERAGLTKTTFFRHFPDKREVLFAGQELHCQLLAEAIRDAPAAATPLEAVGAALDALAAFTPRERHTFCVRLHAVIDAHSTLRERAALKREGYSEAITEALRARSVPEATAAVAADLAVLAYFTAYDRWTEATPPPAPMPDLARRALNEMHAAGMALT